MIVVKVELWSARTGAKIQLAEMHLSNVGMNDSGKVADYHGKVLRRPRFRRSTREGHVAGHRRHDLPVWTLIRKMLEGMGY